MSQVTTDTTTPGCPFKPNAKRGSVQNWLIASAGVVCVGLGALGVFVPGLPTTVFLIMASWLFTKSCPWLERRLIRNRLFRPYLGYLDGKSRMPRRAKAITLVVMWSFVSVSCVMLSQSGFGWWLPALVCALAGVGTFFVVRQGCRVGAAQEPTAEAMGSSEQESKPLTPAEPMAA